MAAEMAADGLSEGAGRETESMKRPLIERNEIDPLSPRRGYAARVKKSKEDRLRVPRVHRRGGCFGV